MDLVLCRGRASFHGSTVVYALIMTKETQDFRLLIQDSSDNSNAMDILTNSSLTRVLVLYVENCIVVSKSLGTFSSHFQNLQIGQTESGNVKALIGCSNCKFQGKSVGAIVLVVRPCDRLCFTRTEEGRKERIRGNQVQSVTCLQLLHDWLLYEEGKE
ncbi:PREDICTED: uncharacterized protein LOC106306697 isoform X1 [Brassica oleracea var. oleracea]|uniref:uncharacterized protein LOC106306697 isoform X1 n=1 Tax=Brassica oleracea var. oleracea TaxID=109376 RepID=UPI0006A6DB06|nr:PREDICTED: uncharacterized protein LOC106306697 isoform X1 [Brassica oleracea var. oleracea]